MSATRPGEPSTVAKRATALQMRQRFDALLAICEEEMPVSVQGVYYRTLHMTDDFWCGKNVKGDRWRARVSAYLTTMRRTGWVPARHGDLSRRQEAEAWKAGLAIKLNHAAIVEAGRRAIVPGTWANMTELLDHYAENFRRELWVGADVYVEVWSEANTMVGVLAPVTDELDVYLRPASGFSSETLAKNAALRINEIGLETFIYNVGDFDPYGMEAWEAIQRRVQELVDVKVHFVRLAATRADRDDNLDLTHKAKPPKNADKTARTRMAKHIDLYGDDVLEADALDSNELRDRVRAAVERHMLTRGELDAIAELETADREAFAELARRFGDTRP